MMGLHSSRAAEWRHVKAAAKVYTEWWLGNMLFNRHLEAPCSLLVVQVRLGRRLGQFINSRRSLPLHHAKINSKIKQGPRGVLPVGLLLYCFFFAGFFFLLNLVLFTRFETRDKKRAWRVWYLIFI